jgi:uncharacterized membrane protein YczE
MRTLPILAALTTASRCALVTASLVLGWLLGGTVGIATVLFAFLIGPLVKPALATLAIREREHANCV